MNQHGKYVRAQEQENKIITISSVGVVRFFALLIGQFSESVFQVFNRC